ncbi:VOC family protein [Rhodococcus sp. NPDC056960]|uniref:VOC family protein n=1 Tax=Rhodococcus TaxID=1827 RepID=UPI0036354879
MIHHLAITPKNFDVSHRFYTEVMGFELVTVVKRQAMGGVKAGWTKHVFYETAKGSGAYFVLWDLHLNDLELGDDWDPSISVGLGLPWWVNHIAFAVDSLDELEQRKQHWLSRGQKVSEVVHEFITSIYTRDPDGNMVEFTTNTRPLTDQDKAEARELIANNDPAVDPDYPGIIYLPDGRIIEAPSSE